MKLSDEAVIRRCLEGDRNAFGLLVAKYQGAVYGLCYHMVGNFADAQDLAQEAFIKAYLDLARIREPARFASWLHRITVNTCNMWLRSMKRVAALPLESIAQVWTEHGNYSSPTEYIQAEEARVSIKEALASLSEKNRLVVTLYYMDGLSCGDIGDFLSLSESAVKNRLLRARKQLREELISMAKDDFDKHKLPKDFAEKAIQEVVNHAGPGRFQVDTTNGSIKWLKTEDGEAGYFEQLEIASIGEPGTYVPYENKSGAGLFVLNTTTGETWWTNGQSWAKPATGRPEEGVADTGTYMPYENKSRAGFFVLNTATGEVWWTNGANTHNPGRPGTKPGESGTYMPYENDLGAGFRIINTRTGDSWWTNGSSWGRVGKVEPALLSMTESQKASRKALLDKAEQLFSDRKFAEAVESYQEMYDKCSSDSLYSIHSLMMLGLCHEAMEQKQKAIDFLERAIKENPDIMGFSEAVYFYLGRAYAKVDQNEKALEKLKKCVQMCGENEDRSAEKFPCKDARDLMQKISQDNQ